MNNKKRRKNNKAAANHAVANKKRNPNQKPNQNQNRKPNSQTRNNKQNQQRRKNINPLSEREIALRKNAQKRKRMIRRRRKLTSVLLIVIICAIAIILSLTVFFHISQIKVDGNTKYNDEQILNSVSLKIQDNLFLSDLNKVEQEIMQNFPYVGEVEVKRQIPSTVTIKIIETTPAYALMSGSGKFTLIDVRGKVLEKELATKPENIPTISGVTISTNMIGEIVVFDDETVFPTISKIVSAIENSGIAIDDYIGEMTPNSEKGEISLIDMSDILNIKLTFADSLVLQLGTATDVDYKLKFAKETIDKLAYGSKGTIDLSTAKQATYSPKY